MTGKKCRKCGTTKASKQFYIDRSKADGLDSWCRYCRNAAARARYAARIEQERARSRAYYDAHRPQVLARYKRTRDRAVAIYGSRCARCRVTRGLEFHHVGLDGGQHRRRFEDHITMLRRIVRAGHPLVKPELLLLCRRHHQLLHHPPRVAETGQFARSAA